MSDSFIGRAKIEDFFGTAKRKPKTHNYTQFVWGEDYIFEPIDEGNGGYMTGYGRGIVRGDYVILSKENNAYHYQVEKIDYYSNPSDMWIALLKTVIPDR
jgi:MioC protein